MEIKISGPGCPKCKTLEKMTREVIEKEGINTDVSKVEDIMAIMNYGVMSTPALVVNEKAEITGEGFMYVDNYDRLKSEVKKAVDKAIKE